jgi:uncharacterized membrane protein (UPF0127 family)
VRRAETAFDRTRGLLGSAELPAGTGLWIDPCPSIHMFFMRYAIDVVFLDKSLRVTRVVEALGPWRVAFGAAGTRSVLEVPIGTIAGSQTEVGHLLAIEPVR